ncbi:hypothetical protein HPB50_005046 [Hyalomma asiaticum]|uniref:Uncharacterized protein n=1 Tax=Hyalomma asiaticum TaxID=266040 RepID=A0ACB7RSQ4_HYAAI|nr:hypothetical protein HPB50_005046 [Hyalomma asiaticum]
MADEGGTMKSHCWFSAANRDEDKWTHTTMANAAKFWFTCRYFHRGWATLKSTFNASRHSQLLTRQTRKRSSRMFLTLMGEAAFITLGNLLFPKTSAEGIYEDVVKTLRNHYTPKRSAVAEQYQFQTNGTRQRPTPR